MFRNVSHVIDTVKYGITSAHAVPAKVEGQRLVNLRPTKSSAIAKSGNISLVGEICGVKVKVYSVFSEDQVQMRRTVSRLSDSIHLPKLIASEGKIIVEEWVNGKSGDKCSKSEKAVIRAAVREFIFDKNREQIANQSVFTSGHFDYLEYIERRIRLWLFITPLRVYLDKWLYQRDKIRDRLTRSLSHPDLSYQNLIVKSDTKEIFSIDNEFLNVGYGGFMDFYNSMLQEEEMSFSVGKEVRAFFENTARLRRIGSCLLVGKPQNLCEKDFHFDDG